MNEYLKKENVIHLLEHNDKVIHYIQRTANAIVDRTVQALCEVVNEMPAADVQPINQWIKTDESLPVYGGMVLVCDKSKNIRLGIYTDMGWCSQFGNPMMCKITHWQPLPEPPQD